MVTRPRPQRGTGPKRPRKMTSNTAQSHTAMERSFAQKNRIDRQIQGINYVSKAKRAEFWTRIQAQEAQYVKEEVAAFDSMPPFTGVAVATANIHQASLQSAAPAVPGSGVSVAGLDQTGFVPPPPTGT